MGLAYAQLRFGLGNFLPAWPRDAELQRALSDRHLGVCDVRRCLRDIAFLFAREGPCGQSLAPLVLAAGIQCFGPCGLELRPRLRDLLRPTSIAQPFDDRLLACNLRLCLRDLRRETAGIEARQNLSLVHEAAFFDEQFGNTLAAVERQRHLAHFDVAVEHDRVRDRTARQIPPCSAGNRGCREYDDKNANEGRFAHLIIAMPDVQVVKFEFEFWI